jgi:hypothetical protein
MSSEGNMASRLQSDHNRKNVKYTATGHLSSTRPLV